MAEFRDASLEKLTQAKKSLERYVGTKHQAASEGVEIDNEYIERGYRINHNSCCSAVKSIGSCHNETVNVWSHLGGAIFFLLIMCSLAFFMPSRQFEFNSHLQFTYRADQEAIVGYVCKPTLLLDSSDLSCFLAANNQQY